MASRLAGFYERSGLVTCLGKERRLASISIIGAVSPPGGDLADPVVQGTLRVTKVFWGLDDQLAFQRHFPAINWLTSYSLYQDVVDRWAEKNQFPAWSKNRKESMQLLKREAELQELVQLVGMDSLSPTDRLLLESSRMVREDFLHQNAFDDIDTYTSMRKQNMLLDVIIYFYHLASEALSKGVNLDSILHMLVLEDISRAKLIKEDNLDAFDQLKEKITGEFSSILTENK